MVVKFKLNSILHKFLFEVGSPTHFLTLHVDDIEHENRGGLITDDTIDPNLY